MNSNMKLENYKAVFLDAGDTLITVPQAHITAEAYLKGKNLNASSEHINAIFKEAFDRFYYEKEPDAKAECSPESDRLYWVRIYHYVLKKLGARETLSEYEIHSICHELYDLFVSPEQYVLFDDVKPTLEMLRKKGLQIGLVSNFAPTLRDILQDKGILHYFDPVIVSTEVGVEKPNPRIFQLALEASGLSPSEVLYVGDHDVNDVWAPSQIGMNAVKLLRYSYQSGEGIHSLLELLE